MNFNNLGKAIKNALVFDIFLILSAIVLGRLYLVTIIHSILLNIVSIVFTRVRPKKLGYIGLDIKGYKAGELLFILSSFLPIFNVIFSIFRYHQTVCSSDEKFIENYQGKLLTFKEAIKKYEPHYKVTPFFYIQVVEHESELKKEYENVSTKDFELSLKMNQIEDYIDYIILNKNLTKDQKEYVLLKLRQKVIFNKKIDLNKKTIKKLIKSR